MPRIDLKLKDIPLDVLFRVNSSPVSIVVIRKVGTINAFLDRCPHAHWPLSEGELKDGILKCIGHGWQFDVNTGRCLTVPVCNLKVLPVAIHHDRVQIEY